MELFEVGNLFALGNYQGAINEAEARESATKGTPLDDERRALMYRSYIAQGKPDLVLSELPAPQGLPAALRAVGLLAAYTLASKGPPEQSVQQREQVLTMLKAFLDGDADAATNTTVQVVVATIYTLAGDLQAAMRSVYSSDNLEARAMLVQIFLSVGRPEVAEHEVKAMQKTDDDATWTQLALASIACSTPTSSADRISEAQQIYQELADRFGATAKLLNGLAVAQALQGDFVGAEKSLQAALEKDPRNGDTLANVVVTSLQLGKTPEFIERQLKMLQTEAPWHNWVEKRAAAAASLDQAMTKFAPRVQ